MCIIISSPAGFTLPKWELSNCWENNSDGAGMMYVKDKKIVIVKEFKSWEKFFELYTKHSIIAERHKSPMVLHFRIGTHGVKGLCNVHPFSVSKDLAFCHNGVLKVPDHKKHSDTVMYNKIWLQSLPDKFHLNTAIVGLISEHIGSSKFVFMDSDKNVVILNESLGELDTKTGVWYSNTSFKSPRGWFKRGHRAVWDADDYDVVEWYTKSKDTFPLVSSASEKKLQSSTAIAKILPEKTRCDSCDFTFDTDKLSSPSASSPALLCEKCIEDLNKKLKTKCMWCDADLEEDQFIEMDNGSCFCFKCEEKLEGLGVISAA